MARYNLEVVTKNRSDKYKNDEQEIKEEVVVKQPKKEKIKKEKVKKEKIKKIKEPKESTQPEEVKQLHPALKAILKFLIIITTLFLIYSIFIETNIFYVKEYNLTEEKLPVSFHGLKIVQISDINYGSTFTEGDLEKIINKINELNPDIVFFTGNLIDKSLILDKEKILQGDER